MDKKTIISFFVLGTFVFGETLDTLYKNKNYKECYKNSQELIEQNFENESTNLYYGMCAFELRKFKESIEVLERVLILNENNQRARLELAKSYMALKMYENAKFELQIVLKSNPPESVKTNIEKFLEVIEQKSKQHSYSLVFNIRTGYDSNINASATKEELESLYPNTTSIGEVKANYFNQTFFFKHNYTPRSTNKTAWENSFLAVNQNNFEKTDNANGDDYDYSYFKLISTPVYFSKNYLFKPNFFLSNLFYAGDNLLYTYGLNPTLKYSLDKDTILGVSAQYYQKRYHENIDLNKELDYYDTVLKYTKLFGNDIVELKGMYSKENAVRESSSYVSKDGLGIAFSYLKNMKPWSLSFSSNYTQYDYTNNRDDIQRGVSSSATYDINKQLSLGISLSYQENSSNLIQFEYSKTTAGLMLSYKTKGLF